MVLDALPKPAWLAAPGPHSDIVLTTRARVMRNLAGHRFPHHASADELREVLDKVLESASDPDNHAPLEVQRHVSPIERDYLVACRLVSADFPWNEPGRALLLDPDRKVSLMVNEEDHIRLQSVSGGWSISGAERWARNTLDELSRRLRYAESPRFGFLSASPYNCGLGVRVSAMFHLIGLAHTKRLPKVLAALASRGIVSRGLFGESSRAIGAFVQVSVTAGPREDFAGAGAYLLDQETRARQDVGPEALRLKTEDALHLVQVSRRLGLPDALRLLAWLRWAAASGIPGVPERPSTVDQWFTTLILKTTGDEDRASTHRASFLRSELGL